MICLRNIQIGYGLVVLNFCLSCATFQTNVAKKNELILNINPQLNLIWMTPISTSQACLNSFLSVPSSKQNCIKWTREENASPLFVPSLGEVFVGGQDSKIHVFSVSEQSLQRSAGLPGQIASQPVFANGDIFLGLKTGYIICLDAASLEIKWQTQIDASIAGPLLVKNSQVYLISKLASVYSIDKKSGKILWVKKRYFFRKIVLQMNAGPTLSIINLKGDEVVTLACPHPDGRVDFCELTSGKVLNTLDVGDRKLPFPDIVASAVFVERNIIVASYNKGIMAASYNLKKKWQLPIKEVVRLFVDGGLVFAATPQEVIGINAVTGQIIWRFGFNNGQPTNLVSDDLNLYFGVTNSGFFALDKFSGKMLQSFGPKLGFKNQLSFSSGNLFAVSVAGHLYAFGLGFGGKIRLGSSCDSGSKSVSADLSRLFCSNM